MKDGEEFLLKKDTPKNTRGLKPYQNQPFCGHLHNKKEAPTGNTPMGDNPKAVISHFLPIRGNQTTEVTRVIFNPTTGAEGMVTPPPNDYLTSTNPLILSGYKANPKHLALASCIQSLLNKNTTERVENTKSLGFYSHLFLVPKPNQKWRLVMDLSRFNTFLIVEKFKMETPE